jgi:hypothetical protein
LRSPCIFQHFIDIATLEVRPKSIWITQFGPMQNIFYFRCQVEHEKISTLAVENPSRLQGYTLFMAELFQNVKVSSYGNWVATVASRFLKRCSWMVLVTICRPHCKEFVDQLSSMELC